MDNSPRFDVGSCSVPGEAPEERLPVLTREALLEALREFRVPDARGIPISFTVAKCQVSFETPSVIATRTSELPLLTPDLEAWVPSDLELALLVRGNASRAALLIGGHTVEGVPTEAPSPPYAPGARGFRFELSPHAAAALLINEALLAIDARPPAVLPGIVLEELRAHLPRELDVPLTLVEF